MGFSEGGAGFRNTDTSRAAAESIESDLPHMRRIVLREIARAGTHGVTADEIGARLGLVRMSVQPRCSDLRRLGKIGDSGLRGVNVSGRKAIRWVTRAALAKLEGRTNG